MKRDFDYFRDILLNIEADTFDDLEKNMRLLRHLELIQDEGLIEFDQASWINDKGVLSMKITNEGHNFLDAIRDNEKWEEVKKFQIRYGSVARAAKIVAENTEMNFDSTH